MSTIRFREKVKNVSKYSSLMYCFFKNMMFHNQINHLVMNKLNKFTP